MTDDAKLLAEIDDRCTTYWAGGDCKLWSDVHLLARARDRIAALERQLAEARPIPREPTEAMVQAAYDISDEKRYFIDRLPDYWRAMYDAALAQPEGEGK